MNRIANAILFVYLPVYAATPQSSLGQDTAQEAHGDVPQHCESGVAYIIPWCVITSLSYLWNALCEPKRGI